MSEIRILPEQVANQIAAGEVVERPASVVKELVENAIDAGARSIGIEVEAGGSRLIRVIDDGRGMDADDMLLCLERHATSKIKSAEDLAAITTLGYRGEALPSIASVSLMFMTSRLPGTQLGNRVEVRFGKIVKVHEMGASQGTVVEIRQLFGNVPARRKFLKSVRTELAHIEEAALSFALYNPQMGFSYSVDGRRIFQFAADADTLASRMGVLAGGKSPVALVSVGTDRPAGVSADGVKVGGYLFPPDGASWPGNKLRLFINGRLVKDRLLSQAVFEGAEGFFMKGRRPVGLIMVDVDPSMVDVNVHPTKQEVRFRKPSQVFQAVSGAVRSGLSGFQREVSRRLFGGGKVRPERGSAKAISSSADVAGACKSGDAGTVATREPQPLFTGSPVPVATERLEPTTRGEAITNTTSGAEISEAEGLASLSSDRPGNLSDSEGVRLIGQLHTSYLLLEDNEHLLVIDQHAAQERLLFERLRRQYAEGSMVRQPLLFPVVVEVSAEELQTAEQFAAEIARLGLELQHFGGESLLIKEVPALLGFLDPEVLLRSLLARFSEMFKARGRKKIDRVEELIAEMACKTAIKANHRLSRAEMENLVQQMRTADVFSHCPHGRPVFKRFSRAEIEKWFYRT